MSNQSFNHREIDAQSVQNIPLILNRQNQFDEKDQDIQNVQDVQTFNMILPPPNITGTLHLGHSLNITIQDMIARYQLLKGKHVTWIPGVDHAGIATQIVVEKQLMKETSTPTTRHDIGREAFIKKLWMWKEINNDMIQKQLRTLHSSINYDLEQFTMSPELSKAVTDAFILLHKKGLIYRDLKMVDYCCNLKTVISNIEVEVLDIENPTKYVLPNGIETNLGFLYDIRYDIDVASLTIEQSQFITDHNIDHIVVSTTRPETLFGDIAVAVNSKDPRYVGLENIPLKLPMTNRTIPIIYDDFVKMDVGTGAVKITPAHDPNDYMCYQRNKVMYGLGDFIEVITDDGKMKNTDVFDDVDRFICRKYVITKLTNDGLLVRVNKHKTSVNVCSRSGDILEPRLKYQWYINTNEMSQKAIEAVDNGSIKITPDPNNIHSNAWRRALNENIHWCISRQLWWGHRIPAYKLYINDSKINDSMIDDSKIDSNSNTDAVGECGQWIIASGMEDAISQVNEMYPDLVHEKDFILEQDEDVLDTWFSSGLYPFSILDGKFFPLDVLETGKDILFFWVARMVMLSLTIKNVVPFHTIYLHNVIRDIEGRKMSKSLGNVIDPLDIIYGITRDNMQRRISDSNLNMKEINRAILNIKKTYSNGITSYGVDSLRLGLVNYLRQNTDINLEIQTFKTAHAFLNKLWNIMNMYEYYSNINENVIGNIIVNAKYNNLITKLTDYIDNMANDCLDWNIYENLEFSKLYENIYQYVMNNYCSFYLEALKIVLSDQTYHGSDLMLMTLKCLRKTLIRIVLYVYPICPNITIAMLQKIGFNPKIDSDSQYISQYISQCIKAGNNKNVTPEYIVYIDTLKIAIENVRSQIHEILCTKNKYSAGIDNDFEFADIITFMTKSIR